MVTDATVLDVVRRMAAELVAVEGVVGVTLGGSRARGTHTPASDVDLGIYYDPTATRLSDELTHLTARWTTTPATVGQPGSWGPWVDAGAWLTLADLPSVDWILRDVDRVAHQVDRARRGEYAFWEQPGHPLGFLDVSYAGELATAVVLADPSGRLGTLRARLDPYPQALADAVQADAWQVGFHLDAAAKAAPRADITYVAISLGKALMLAAHGMLAARHVWVTNEKGLVLQAARHEPRLAAAASELARLGTTADDLAAAIDRVRALVVRS